MTEAFDYNQAGQVTAKLVTIAKSSSGQVASGSLGGFFYYDNEGKIVDQYVDDPTTQDAGYSRYVHYSYEAMSRPTGTTDNGDYKNWQHVYGPTVNVASNATYYPADNLNTVQYYNPANGAIVTETRSYNSLNQLTEISVPTVMDMIYTYADGANSTSRMGRKRRQR